jgi:hypothetical protein
MGVYSTVQICIQRDAPLELSERLTLLEICLKQEMLKGPCDFHVPATAKWTDFITRLWRKPQLVLVESQKTCGPWLLDCARKHPLAFQVHSLDTTWEDCSGRFKVSASDKPFPVHTYNAYRDPKASKNPHVDPDGLVGHFYDVLALTVKSGPNGRQVASSGFVREIKKALDVKVSCRASWA